ncbi:MFS transporter [Ottowia testudinis]|uniref:MFS transporter n=2 Tax=Ottowia testudinis TaxID=2816950 RepID=A0A975CKR1_9BURK|nr:MFS transporter [Ottowia testudinis]
MARIDSHLAEELPTAAPLSPLLLINFVGMAASYAFIAVIGPLARLLHLHAWQVGVMVGIVGVVWAALSGPWGRMADNRGRISVLRRALAGFTLAYLALAVYVWWALQGGPHAVPAVVVSLVVLLATRGVMGAFYAGIPVAMTAWIADHTQADNRAAALAKLGAAGAIGMVLAPPLAGWIAQRHLPLALLVFALLPAVGLTQLRRLHEARQHEASVPREHMRPTEARIFLAWISSFALFSSVIIANTSLGFYLIDRLGIAAANAAAWTGYALGCAGLALILAQAAVAHFKQVTPLYWLGAGALLGAAGFAATLLASTPPAICAAYFVAGLGMGAAFPAVSAIAANAVAAHEQSACAAAMSMAQGLSMVVAPVVGTALYDWRAPAPFALIVVLLALVGSASLVPQRTGSDK